MQRLIAAIEHYRPRNEREEADRLLILRALREEKDILTRDNDRMHMTASAWITNKDRTRVLMVYHNIYHSWSWCGGHADGCADLLQVALREAYEETGVAAVPYDDKILSLEVLAVNGHYKHGKYVPCHLHLNVTYHLVADEDAPLTVCCKENSGVRWFSCDEIKEVCNEPWMMEHIYQKLIAAM